MFKTLAVQSWTFYAISVSIISSRIISRRLTLGYIKKLQADDWLMLLVLLPYSASIVLANQVGGARSATERKFRYVLEEMQIIIVWLVQACLLILYWRILPIQTSTLKRRSLQGISAFCCASFFIVQASLMLWCQPTEAHWDLTSNNPQCASYHNHIALTLSFNIPNALFVMVLPVPFIPTPRRLLLTILLFLGTLILVTGIVARSLVFITAVPSTNATSAPSIAFLHWYTFESTLSIMFANLPFLTSLVVTAAPERLRHFSSQLALSQWPRSRRGSREMDTPIPPLRLDSKFNGTATTITEMASPSDSDKVKGWNTSTQEGTQGSTRHSGASSHRSAIEQNSALPTSPAARLETRDSSASSHTSTREISPDLPSPPHPRPETPESQVPKMRLSGGLAEMGELSLQDTTQGWPIYWR